MNNHKKWSLEYAREGIEERASKINADYANECLLRRYEYKWLIRKRMEKLINSENK